MFRKALAILVSTAFGISFATARENPLSQTKLSGAEVMEKNVAARGRLQAWRAVQTLLYAGHLGAGTNQWATRQLPIPRAMGRQQLQQHRLVPQRPLVPFLIEFARPRKQRIELQYKGQRTVQVFDGAEGWRLRPFLNRHEVEPFTDEEVDATSMYADLDGPLVDYAAKGNEIELDGMEKVQDRDTYKIKVTLNHGKTLRVWIDSQTFLEMKIEGMPRQLNGIFHPTEIYYRDYRSIDGLQIPFLLETRVSPATGTAPGFMGTLVPAEKMVIDKVVVNPKLDLSLFSKAGIEPASNAE
jgi:hypothetical protein